MTNFRISISVLLMLSLIGCGPSKEVQREIVPQIERQQVIKACKKNPKVSKNMQGAVSLTAKQVVEKLQSELIAVMKDGKKLGYAGRYEELSEPILNSHDITRITSIIIGTEWDKLSDNKRRKLTDIFDSLFITSYAHNFKDYSGESFVFDFEEVITGGGIVVHTHFVIPDDNSIKFDYLLKAEGNYWRILNTIVNGVSDLALKRAAYTTILEREGFDALMTKVNERIDSYSNLNGSHIQQSIIHNNECIKPSISATSTTPVQTVTKEKPVSLQGFKTQCKQLGFKVGTTDFGNCVLELNDSK